MKSGCEFSAEIRGSTAVSGRQQRSRRVTRHAHTQNVVLASRCPSHWLNSKSESWAGRTEITSGTHPCSKAAGVFVASAGQKVTLEGGWSRDAEWANAVLAPLLRKLWTLAFNEAVMLWEILSNFLEIFHAELFSSGVLKGWAGYWKLWKSSLGSDAPASKSAFYLLTKNQSWLKWLWEQTWRL